MTRRARPSPTRTDGPESVVRVDKVVAEGDGLARLDDGRVVFVAGALPGESVRIRITKQSRDYARANAIEIIDPHPQRMAPPCRFVSAGCGGCDLQHASLGLQWEIKRDIVKESLVRLGKITDPVVHHFGHGSATPDGLLDDRAKRSTIRVIGDSAGRPGFRRQGSHDVIAVERCLVADDRLSSLFETLRLDPGHEAVLRCGQPPSEPVAITDPSTTLDGLPETVVAAPVHTRVGGVDFTVSPDSFFQSSPMAAEDLVDAVRAALGEPSSWIDGPVVDAFGGVGLFSATVVPADRAAILIEVSESSCRDARLNLVDRRARIVNLPLELWRPEPAAVVIADPPRDGLRAAGVSVLAATGAPLIVLVSCDPASLGRDARLLTDAGYRFVSASVLGAFPHTHHVETVSRFEKVE